MLVQEFQDLVYAYYHSFGRNFAWRNTKNPYHIVVSEIMLQQTQTYRVVGKFENFIKLFPDFVSLAQAPMRDLLAAWQGLGYNRRALALQRISQRVVTEFNGTLPQDPKILQTFPGIGPNTAGSICAFAFNIPTIFIETNIRSVYIHCFFRNQTEVHDKMLLPFIEKTLDNTNPRDWYYALMDYGVALKKRYPNPSRKSAHHAQQSRFEGSDRQVRGAILRLLTQNLSINLQELKEMFPDRSARIEGIVADMIKEGFVQNDKENIMLM